MAQAANEGYQPPKGSPEEWRTLRVVSPGIAFGRLPACWIEDVAALSRARISQDIASVKTMRKVHAAHRDSFWAIFSRSQGQPHTLIAYFAQLLLTEAGHHALLARTLNLRDPQAEYLAVSDATCAAVYMWGIVAEKKAALIHPLLSQQLAHLTHLPHYGTPATEAGIKEARYIGMEPVAPQDDHVGGLFVMSRSMHRPPRVSVKVAATAEEFEHARMVRTLVFMGEQNCPFEEEFDGNDYCGAHLVGYVGTVPVATMRMRFFSDWVKLERMAVLRPFRDTLVKSEIIYLAFETARRKGYRRCYGQAQERLLDFWLGFGFELHGRNEPLRFSDHNYVEIVRDLEPHPQSITLFTDPMVINRPEGCWDKPGVLDRSAVRAATNPS